MNCSGRCRQWPAERPILAARSQRSPWKVQSTRARPDTIRSRAFSLLTGLVVSLGTAWGLFRYYWVLITFALTTFSVVILLLHMPAVSSGANAVRETTGTKIVDRGGDLLHPGVGLLVLLVITILNIYKPRGLTPYGWRKQREERGQVIPRA